MTPTDTTMRLLEITASLDTSAPPSRVAGEVLDLLRTTLPYASARVATFNPMTGTHHTVVSVGLTGSQVAALELDLREHGVTAHDRDEETCTVRWSTPADGSETATACLHTRDGRYTGSLLLRSSSPPPAGWAQLEATAVLRHLQPLIAGLSDGMRLPSQLAAGGHPDACGAVVLPDARVVPLPHRTHGRHLRAHAPLTRAIADAHHRGQLPERFRWRDETGGWHVVQARPFEDGVVVTESDEILPFGLTAREMDVLTLVAGGYSNPQIAEALVVSGKTVAKHVEHLLDKLGCASRTGAAAAAVRLGLIELAVQVPNPGPR